MISGVMRSISPPEAVLTLQSLVSDLAQIPEQRRYGRVTAVLGMLLEIGGVPESLAVGGRCEIIGRYGSRLPCEVVGFRNNRALLMPFGAIDGIGLGCKAEVANSAPVVYPHEGWLGRVVNALGEPIDGKGPLPQGRVAYPLRNQPPPAHARQRVHGKVDLGVRAINTFLTCCRGQRMGIFAGSGVGKSVLLSMMARYTQADVAVIGLIGERGLSAGEPPASKGYTPTVFAELPRLLERAGPGSKRGSITGLFTVLVEGDDHNEPVADAVRGILDGHVILERRIGERGRYPAIDVLRSVSRA